MLDDVEHEQVVITAVKQDGGLQSAEAMRLSKELYLRVCHWSCLGPCVGG